MDNVNHPVHYAETCSMECIDVMQLLFGRKAMTQYCMINAFKYMWRCKHKGGQEDLQKAEWYLTRAKVLGLSSDEIGKHNDLVRMVKQLKEEL